MAGTLQNGSFYGGVRAERGISGLTLAETAYEPGFVVPAHDHAHPFFCLALRGSFVEELERRRWTATPATVFYHPAGATHGERFGGAGGRLFNIQLSGDWLARLARFDVRPPERQVRSSGGRLTRIALHMLEEFRASDTASALALDGLALALMAQVIRAPEDRPKGRGRRPAWLGRVESLLNDAVGEPTSIASIAADVDIHPVHLARVFRRHHGCSPAEYLRRRRVRRACALLAEGGESLAAVAYGAGYADQSHFTRHFKRAMGVTPGEYRKLVR